MFNRLTNLIWWDYNQKQINTLRPIVNQINERYDKFEWLSDEEIKAKTNEFKERLNKWETLDDILPEAFAVVKQACKRMVWETYDVKWEKQTWNMIPYDVQLLWWIILHQWKIAEMKTWEWKTLVAAAPVYLNALSGKWVHVVTVNDYLASRDAQWIWYLYQWLGLTVWSVVKWTPLQKRREEYSKDITYVENSELWFDYLRDNLVQTMERRNLIWRPLNFAIVDEIDSILIDEARTPLIISEAREEPTEKYTYYANIVNALTPCSGKKKVSKWLLNELVNDEPKEQEEDWDYYIDEKTKTASLSGKWIAKLEQLLNVENLYKDFWFEEIHHIENALRAKAVYIRDVDYIVSNGEVLIVDEHTGRTMPWRRFSEGLHQAIEAKENVQIQRESQTMATITYQNFFKQYTKLAGMTGTAATEAEEFQKIYELEVVIVPTNKPVLRVDKHDKVYFNQQIKRKFVKDYIKFYHEIGQPILIWTADIATSEYVSRILEKDAITHYVLNAKFHEQEAHIVANAGKYQSVVVATNMAWRGTDIKLEEWLNEKMATNYAKWCAKQLKNQTALRINVYSKKEYDLTINAIKDYLELDDNDISKAEKELIIKNELKINIQKSKERSDQTNPYAKIRIESTQWSKELIEKDFHYGLFILWTEKHESRRIDNQLRWRAGRQWDPGVSVFFVALDDTLMRKMWWERIQAMAWMLLSKEDLAELELTQKQFTSSITRSQKEIEAWHFSTRKHLFDYDSVIDKQRKRIYFMRDSIIEANEDEEKKSERIKTTKQQFMLDSQEILNNQILTAEASGQSCEDLLLVLSKEFWLEIDETQKAEYIKMDFKTLTNSLDRRLVEYFTNTWDSYDQNLLFNILRDINLQVIDKLRVAHIDDMQYLKDKVWFMWYAQMDPLIVYKQESFEKFEQLQQNIKIDTTTKLMRIDYNAVAQQQEAQSQLLEIVQDNPELMEKLKEASKQFWWRIPVQISKRWDKVILSTWNKKEDNDPRKMIFEDEDWIEIFDADDIQNKKREWAILPTKKKIRPNDPCPCGSGKKYKKCHWSETDK